jgi:hypothetical protein
MNHKASNKMGKEDIPPESFLELREEVLQRVEAVGGKIKRLSQVTIFVAAALALGFVTQIVLPYLGGSATQTVNLADPVLVEVEVVLTALALVWLYVGVSDYRFTARLARSIRRARANEKEIEKEISPSQGGG